MDLTLNNQQINHLCVDTVSSQEDVQSEMSDRDR